MIAIYIVNIIILIITLLFSLFIFLKCNPYYYEYYIINYNYTPLCKYLKKSNSQSNNINNYKDYKIVFLFSHDYYDLPESAKYAIKIAKEYCQRHNYELLIKNHYPNNQISPYWLRVFDLINLSKQYNENTIFIYLDLDAAINPKYFDIPMTNLINIIEFYDKKKYDIFIGKDIIQHNFINTGVMFIKNTNQTKKILQMWSKLYNNNNWKYINNKWKCINNTKEECKWAGKEYEQGALELLYINNSNNLKNYIKILHMSFCSNRFNNYDSFIYHFMAQSENERLINMKDIYFKLKYADSYKERKLYSLLKEPNKLLEDNIDTSIIPNNLFQTYFNKEIIPDYIFKNIKTYASNYKYYLLDDNDALIFLNKYFNYKIVNKFNSLTRGAHKADLLRYCLLYIYGGIYIDIKTILIKKLDDIFTNKTYFYSCLAISKEDIYQGIIASPPRNILFLSLINFIINTDQKLIDKNYFIFIHDMYTKIVDDLINKKLNLGLNIGKLNNYYIFEEECLSNTSELCMRPDRYKLCCSIYDNKNKIFIGRDPTFPWE